MYEHFYKKKKEFKNSLASENRTSPHQSFLIIRLFVIVVECKCIYVHVVYMYMYMKVLTENAGYTCRMCRGDVSKYIAEVYTKDCSLNTCKSCVFFSDYNINVYQHLLVNTHNTSRLNFFIVLLCNLNFSFNSPSQ